MDLTHAATSPRHSIELGELLLEVAPAIGGSISRFSIGSTNVLRPLSPHSEDVLESACFPLVPIVNRIPEGRCTFEGREITLQPNLNGSKDFLHGQGWRAPWTVSDKKPTSITLRFEHTPGEWPWTYTATQHFQLQPSGFRCELSVTNTSEQRMPAGLGFHPYFLRNSTTRVRTHYEGYWEANEVLHPQQKRPGSLHKNWLLNDSVDGSALTDHTHYGFGGTATITEPGRPTIKLTAHPACDNLHIYTPIEGNAFCLEPVTDRADPFGEDPRQIAVLAPDESLTVWMEITVSRW